MTMIRVVHVSGYTLAEEDVVQDVYDRNGRRVLGHYHDWERVCWGEGGSEQRMGRIPMGIWLARVLKAEHLIWSTGCSRYPSGIWESERLYERANHSFEDLMRNFPKRFPRGMWHTEKAYRRWLDDISRFDTTSHNTATSMEAAALLVKEYVGKHDAVVYLVSSGNHVPRVVRDAQQYFPIDGSGKITLAAVPAETSYGKKDPSHTIVRDLGD